MYWILWELGRCRMRQPLGMEGADTLVIFWSKMETLKIPNLQKLGLVNLHPGGRMKEEEHPIGRYARFAEASNGKDTIPVIGEMMGLRTEKPFRTFTENGFRRN